MCICAVLFVCAGLIVVVLSLVVVAFAVVVSGLLCCCCCVYNWFIISCSSGYWASGCGNCSCSCCLNCCCDIACHCGVGGVSPGLGTYNSSLLHQNHLSLPLSTASAVLVPWPIFSKLFCLQLWLSVRPTSSLVRPLAVNLYSFLCVDVSPLFLPIVHTFLCRPVFLSFPIGVYAPTSIIVYVLCSLLDRTMGCVLLRACSCCSCCNLIVINILKKLLS